MLFKHLSFLYFLLCSLILRLSPPLVNKRSWLSILSIWFTCVYMIIRSSLCLFFSVINCISLYISSYVSFSSSDTSLIALLWILSIFLICFYLCGDDTTSAYPSLDPYHYCYCFPYHNFIHVVKGCLYTPQHSVCIYKCIVYRFSGDVILHYRFQIFFLVLPSLLFNYLTAIQLTLNF